MPHFQIYHRPAKAHVSSPLFKLTPVESLKLKLPIHQSMKRFHEGKATGNDWHDMAVRFLAGRHLIEKLYTEESVVAFEEAIKVLMQVLKRPVGPERLIFTPDDLETLQAGVEAVDTVQDEVLRKDLLEAFRIAQKAIRPKIVTNKARK